VLQCVRVCVHHRSKKKLERLQQKKTKNSSCLFCKNKNT
jgi:hypothetical protein